MWVGLTQSVEDLKEKFDLLWARTVAVPWISTNVWVNSLKSLHPACLVTQLVFATHGTVACQAPLSVSFSKQEYWSGLPCPSPGDLPNPGIQHTSPASQVGSLTLSHQGSLLLKNSPRDCGPNTVQFAVIHGRLFCPPPLQEAKMTSVYRREQVLTLFRIPEHIANEDWWNAS